MSLALDAHPIHGLPHMVARRAVERSADYSFRSGEPVDMARVSRARSFASGATYALSIVMALDGKSDAERDFNLDEAVAALDEARRLLADARHPEPPRVAPAALPTMFETACDIAKTAAA